MENEYDYGITVRKLDPPLGRDRYAAKVNFLLRLKAGGRSERVDHGVGEHLGKTEGEAHEKVRKAVEKWIQSHP